MGKTEKHKVQALVKAGTRNAEIKDLILGLCLRNPGQSPRGILQEFKDITKCQIQADVLEGNKDNYATPDSEDRILAKKSKSPAAKKARKRAKKEERTAAAEEAAKQLTHAHKRCKKSKTANENVGIRNQDVNKQQQECKVPVSAKIPESRDARMQAKTSKKTASALAGAPQPTHAHKRCKKRKIAVEDAEDSDTGANKQKQGCEDPALAKISKDHSARKARRQATRIKKAAMALEEANQLSYVKEQCKRTCYRHLKKSKKSNSVNGTANDNDITEETQQNCSVPKWKRRWAREMARF